MTDKLSARAYRSAVRMWESDPGRVAKPKPEDYEHLDAAAAPAAPAQPQRPALAAVPTSSPAAVRAAFERMQHASRVQFIPPDDAA